MFDMKSTYREIMEYPLMREYLSVLMAPFILEFVPTELENESLEVIESKLTMPWGGPYLSEELLEAVNIAISIMKEKNWIIKSVWDGGKEIIPNFNKGKESVMLFSKNKKSTTVRPAVIICPGGGYTCLSTVKEGIQIGERMEQEGYKAFVLNYRVMPMRYPEPQLDLCMALKYVRTHAAELGVDPDDILIMGASAGGHLCASYAAMYTSISEKSNEELAREHSDLYAIYNDVDARPDKVCLSYPVISFIHEAHEDSFIALTGGDESLRESLSVEKIIGSQYPKTFIWACEDDELVSVSNARRMYEALIKHKVECCLHIYESGGHGCGLASGTSAEGWLDEMVKYMK